MTPLTIGIQQQKPIVKCKRCGRELTDPVSKARGYGEQCWIVIEAEIFEINSARDQGVIGFLCDLCGEPTPNELMQRGQCPICRYPPATLRELDAYYEGEVG